MDFVIYICSFWRSENRNTVWHQCRLVIIIMYFTVHWPSYSSFSFSLPSSSSLIIITITIVIICYQNHHRPPYHHCHCHYHHHSMVHHHYHCHYCIIITTILSTMTIKVKTCKSVLLPCIRLILFSLFSA